MITGYVHACVCLLFLHIYVYMHVSDYIVERNSTCRYRARQTKARTCYYTNSPILSTDTSTLVSINGPELPLMTGIVITVWLFGSQLPCFHHQPTWRQIKMWQIKLFTLVNNDAGHHVHLKCVKAYVEFKMSPVLCLNTWFHTSVSGSLNWKRITSYLNSPFPRSLFKNVWSYLIGSHAMHRQTDIIKKSLGINIAKSDLTTFIK